MAAAEYRLDELGWLQFQELCAAVVEAETGVGEEQWHGAADDCDRDVLLPESAVVELPPPVLASVVWLRPRLTRRGRRTALHDGLEGVLRRLQVRQREGSQPASVLVMTNAGGTREYETMAKMLRHERVQVGLVSPAELSDLLDARAPLRRRMPATLGTTSIDRLVEEDVATVSSFDRDTAERLAPLFVATRPYRRAVESLEQNGFVVLTGPPEVGKTAIAQMVALVQLTDGWEAHDCRHPDEVFSRYRADRAQIFIADDAFGSTEYRPDTAERWARELDRVLARMDERHWLVWTSRPAPLAAGLRRVHRERGLERFPDPGSVQIDASRLSVEEKALILFRHARAAGLGPQRRHFVQFAGEEIVAHRYFTPERIRRLAVAIRDEQFAEPTVDAALRHPTEAMRSSLTALEGEHRDLLVALLDAPPALVSERDLTRALRRHHPGGLTRAPHELIDRLADHFLRVSEGSVGWVHPSWRDLVIDHLAADPDARRRFLRVAGIDGVELALSVAGGALGERDLPLVASDEDWDVLTTRALELARELGDEELTRLLHAVAEASASAAEPWSRREAAALARELLAATTARVPEAVAPVPLLEAWLRAAAQDPGAPQAPPVAHIWARLVPAPPFDDPAEVARADDWLALAEVLWRYRGTDLDELGFPDRYPGVLAALVDAGTARPEDLVLSRALTRLTRLVPDLPGLMPLLPEFEYDEPRRPLGPTPDAASEAFSVASVLADL